MLHLSVQSHTRCNFRWIYLVTLFTLCSATLKKHTTWAGIVWYELRKNLMKDQNSSTFVLPQRKFKPDFQTQMCSGATQVTLNEVDGMHDFERPYKKKKKADGWHGG